MNTYIVIPNYIVTAELHRLAINTIKSMRSNDVFIVFVDDGSPMDCSIFETMADKYIKNEKNSGFAISCNNGFRWIFENEKDDCYIICANNDIELYGNWLETLTKPFEVYEKVGITGMISCKDRASAKTHRINKITEGGLLSDYMQDGALVCSKKSILLELAMYRKYEE